MPKDVERAEGRLTGSILRQNGIAYLLYLAKNAGWHHPSNVARAVGGEPKYAAGTARRLHEARLVEIRPEGAVAGKATFRMQISPFGREIAGLLRPVVDKIERRRGPSTEARRR